MLKFLSILKPLRTKTSQYIEEQKAIDQWLNAVIKATSQGYYLACQTANLAILARGYGDVRKTGLKKLDLLFIDWEKKLANDHSDMTAQVDQMILLAHSNPDII